MDNVGGDLRENVLAYLRPILDATLADALNAAADCEDPETVALWKRMDAVANGHLATRVLSAALFMANSAVRALVCTYELEEEFLAPERGRGGGDAGT